ncbi:hypothetical protein BS78_03G143400 [Paspalum vaginatum]|nr:hypothetical protein BS78_03G143400 [Paspalum vaginatum]
MDYKPVLPLDVVYEILLQVPAKTLCRLRAVCRPWRSLLARRKDGDRITGMSSDLVCIKAVHNGSYRLVNPATGAVCRLPQHLAQEHVARGLKLRDYCDPVHMFGSVSNGEYKVLRMLPRRNPGTCTKNARLLEVCTLNSSRRRRARWRGGMQLQQAASLSLVWDDWMVINGVVYLLKDGLYLDWIVPFDLETEEWRPHIAGPGHLIDADAYMFGGEVLRLERFALTNINGSLAIAHGLGSSVDIWFLVDSKGCRWVEKWSVQVYPYYQHRPLNVRPLVVLDDGG